MKDELKALFEQTLKDLGGELEGTLDDIAAYASARAAHLATLVGQPGFEKAVIAERNSVALRAGLSVTADARAVDQRLVGLIQGALYWGAKALAAV